MRHRQGLGIGTLALGLLLGLGCAPLQVAPAVSPLGPAVLRVEPAQATLTTGQTTRFQARAQDGSRPTVAWEAVGGGTVDSSGQYAAPSTPGGYLLRARAFGVCS